MNPNPNPIPNPNPNTCQHRPPTIPPPPWLGKLRLLARRASNAAPARRAPSSPGDGARDEGADGAAYLGGVPGEGWG